MYEKMLDALQKKIKERVPSFEVKLKNESIFMKIIGKLLFFNKRFMTDYTNVIGTKVYFPYNIEQHPLRSFLTLSHEYVHIMDYKRNPVVFILGFLFPQILSILSLLAVISPWFLLFLIFLAPLPAPYRKWIEMRGYGMNIKLRIWLGRNIDDDVIDKYAEQFTGSAYYFMWPFKSIKNELREWTNNDLEFFNDAYKDVYNILKHENI